MTLITSLLWFISVSAILTMLLLIIISNYGFMDKFFYSLGFLAFLPLYAISFMISSWVNEHEANCYAVKSTGSKPMIRALIKLHIYSKIKGFESFISPIEPLESFKFEKISYFQVFKTIMRESLIYFDPKTVMSQPIPKTYPPLRLRIEKTNRIEKINL